MLKKILAVLAVIIVAFVAFVATRPSEFRVTRTDVISAAPSAVFSQVNDLHKWKEWSPWAKLDPEAKETFEGPSEGVGARMHWTGNNQVGTGSMTITESEPSSLIMMKLDFLKPFKATNRAEFLFRPEGNQTIVTWSMFGESNFIGKAMSLFIDCEKMVGSQFEKGLVQLKTVVEAQPAPV